MEKKDTLFRRATTRALKRLMNILHRRGLLVKKTGQLYVNIADIEQGVNGEDETQLLPK